MPVRFVKHFRALHEIYGPHNRSTTRSIYRLVNELEHTGSIANKLILVRHWGARSEVNIAAANLSISRRSQELDLSQ